MGAAASAKHLLHNLQTRLREQQARNEDAQAEAAQSCHERDAYNAQLLRLKHTLTGSEMWIAGIDTKQLNEMVAQSTSKCNGKVALAEKAAASAKATAEQVSEATEQWVELTAEANS